MSQEDFYGNVWLGELERLGQRVGCVSSESKHVSEDNGGIAEDQFWEIAENPVTGSKSQVAVSFWERCRNSRSDI